MEKRMKKKLMVMTMMVLFVLALCISAKPAEAAGKKTSAGLDIVLVVDNSRSIWCQQEERNEALKSIADLAAGADIRIGGVFFAGKICDKLELTSMENEEGIKKVVDGFLDMKKQDKNNVDTNIGRALQSAQTLFDKKSADRKKVIILFSDGKNENEKGEAIYKAKADIMTMQQTLSLRSKEIPIYCVYLQKKVGNEDYLRDIVNYFMELKLDETRFFKVKESEIEKLTDAFAEVFYDVQSEMNTEPPEATEAPVETETPVETEAAAEIQNKNEKVEEDPMKEKILVIAALIVFAAVLAAIFRTLSRRARRKKIRMMEKERGILYRRALEKLEVLEDVDLDTQRFQYKNLVESIWGMCQDEVVLSCFGLTDYIKEGAWEELSGPFSTSVEELKNTARALQKTKRVPDGLDTQLADLNANWDRLDVVLKDMEQKALDLKRMLETEISSKLCVRHGGYTGMMMGAQGKTGYYRLDQDVKLISVGQNIETLQSLIGKEMPKIVVHAYEKEEDATGMGLVFSSETPFQIKETASGESAASVTHFKLLKGRQYELQVRTVGYISISIE